MTWKNFKTAPIDRPILVRNSSEPSLMAVVEAFTYKSYKTRWLVCGVEDEHGERLTPFFDIDEWCEIPK